MDKNRINKLLSLMPGLSAERLAISPGPNLKYLTGLEIEPHERTFMMVLGGSQEISFALPMLEEEKVKAVTAGNKAAIFAYSDQDGPVDAVKAAFGFSTASDRKRLAIGAEFLHMRLKEFELIKQALGPIDAADLDSAMMDMRSVKDSQEIAHLKRAAEIVDRGIEAARDAIRPGVSENYVAEQIEKAMMAAGADSVPFNSVLSGPNAALPHGNTSGRVILEGELVICDIGAGFKGYFGDITRTIAAGKPSDELIAAYMAVYEANKAGREAVKPGMKAEDLDAICREVITKAGFGSLFIHRTGHGLGLEVHEEPYIVAGNRKALLPGMAFTIEPGVYIPGVGGVRIEDDVILTETGAEIITRQPRELMFD